MPTTFSAKSPTFAMPMEKLGRLQRRTTCHVSHTLLIYFSFFAGLIRTQSSRTGPCSGCFPSAAIPYRPGCWILSVSCAVNGPCKICFGAICLHKERKRSKRKQHRILNRTLTVSPFHSYRRMAAKTNRFLETMAYFGLREWQIANENVVRLRTLLTPTEASLLEFDLSTVDWDEYFQAYIPGIRRYYLGELPAARDRINPAQPLAWNRRYMGGGGFDLVWHA